MKGFAVAVFVSLGLVAGPRALLLGQANRINPDPIAASDGDDVDACARRVGFYLQSPYTGNVYAGGALRGADTFFAKVFYLFSGVQDQSGTYMISGNFYVYGHECRLGTWLRGGVYAIPLSRVEFTEVPIPEVRGKGDCTDEEPVDYMIYDASYDPTAETGRCGEAGGGDGGTQYKPGDYTGGEMVEWGTGIGTGQPSACGDLAKVEYICIDAFDEATGTWVEWSCGYATVC